MVDSTGLSSTKYCVTPSIICEVTAAPPASNVVIPAAVSAPCPVNKGAAKTNGVAGPKPYAGGIARLDI